MIQSLSQADIEPAFNYLRSKIDFPIQVGIVLGSGLGKFADQIENPVSVPYKQIPGFPRSTVSGHAGEFVAGFIADVSVLVMKGRVHFYEGHPMAKVGMGIRLMAELGVRNLILTNAAGSVNEKFKPGDFMLLNDHLNLLGSNPLIGPNEDSWGPRFLDQTRVYSERMIGYAKTAASELALEGVHEGVYAAMTGPTYETPAEIRMLRAIGADAAGMSTVPEAIVGRHAGMEILGISLITNFGAGISGENLDHSEVMSTGSEKANLFASWLVKICKYIDEE